MLVETENKRIELEEKVNGFSERDIYSKALLNKDHSALLAYKMQKGKTNNMKNMMTDIENMKTQFVSLKSDITDIKKMLLELIGR